MNTEYICNAMLALDLFIYVKFVHAILRKKKYAINSGIDTTKEEESECGGNTTTTKTKNDAVTDM